MDSDKAAHALAQIILQLHRDNFDIGDLAIDHVEVNGEDEPTLTYRWEEFLEDLIPKDPTEPRYRLRDAIVAYEDALVREQLAAMEPRTPSTPAAKRSRASARRVA